MELEANPEVTASLKHLAQGCRTCLQKAVHDEEVREDISKAKDGYWASRQAAEFNLWCAKVGVYGEGLRSIDVRLKDVPEICELLRKLLQSLERDLNELRQPAHTPAQTNKADNNLDDAESDDSSLSFKSLSSPEHSEPEIATEDNTSVWRERRTLAIQRHIEDTIDRLHGHALRIEHAGAKHRRERVNIYLQKEEPKWAYEGFKEIALRSAKAQFPSASDQFRQRIAESFARRRIRFEYLEKHQKKRAVNIEVQEEDLDLPHKPQPEAKDTGDGPVPLVRKKEAPKRANILDQRTIYSVTEDTKLDLRHQAKHQGRPESVASVALRHAGFPPPPQTSGGTFQCPYCRLEFRASEAERHRWSQHVMQDFEPYFCTLEDCEAPFDIPNTFDGLMGHLQDHLPVRYHVDMPHGEHKEFDEAEFEEHVQGYGYISEEMATAMKEASRRKGAFLFESCPFCGGYPDIIEMRFPDPDTLEAQNELRRHIKQHMQDIALFLPPYREEIFTEDDDLNSSAVTRRRSASQNDSKVADDCKTLCSRQDCDCKSKGEYAIEGALGDNPIEDAELSSTIGPGPEVEETDFWPEVFGDSPLYNRSTVTDDDYLIDERLRPFIERFEAELSHTKWPMESLTPEDYHVGIICGLPLELPPICLLLDENHPSLPLPADDSNYHALGRMGAHMVVVACLPNGHGTTAAASFAINLSKSFPSLKFCLSVGIGGGVPSLTRDIRLGDVVVGTSVIQYGLGGFFKTQGEFQPSGLLESIPRQALVTLSRLRSDPSLPQAPLQEYIKELTGHGDEYHYPGPARDLLFSSDFAHSSHNSNSKHASCDSCDATCIIERASRPDHDPHVHYGPIASGNQVIKDAELRDKWKTDSERDILCFEMEAAGIINVLPCLVVRGICDYSDSHKNRHFQAYAAATAAAYAKLFLRYYDVSFAETRIQVQEGKDILDVHGDDATGNRRLWSTRH